jgi:RHS repeat-associated protein
VNAGASINAPITLPGTDQVRTYGLDGLGNWKTSNFTEVGSGGSTTSTAEVRQHNYVNEITGVKDTTGGTPTTTPFTYDKNGNLLNDGIRSYQYDALNRLVKVSNASTSALLATYAYDGLNRRIQKIIADLSGGLGGLTGDIPAGTINYLYDGQQMAMERDGSGNWTQVYFWGQYIDELLFFAVPTETVPTTYRVLSDLLYRSTAIVTTANVVTEAYDTDAYGNTLCYSGPGTDGLWFTNDDVATNNPINTTIFTGRQYDSESQIYYYRARYYSPQIGRFISRDPLEGAELTQGPNPYEYVWDNPVNMLDPNGEQGVLTTVMSTAAMNAVSASATTLFALCQDDDCRKDCLDCCTLTAVTVFAALDSAYFFSLAGCVKSWYIAAACAAFMGYTLNAKTDDINSKLAKCRSDCMSKS